MGTYLDEVPEAVQGHIRSITKTSGLPDTDESIEKIAHAWLEKKRLFEERLEEHEMSEVDEYSADETRGAVLFTYSGSLITVGPGDEGTRSIGYTSIGLRQDVPDQAATTDTNLSEDIAVDGSAQFTNGPIKKSSPVYSIAISPEDLSSDETEELVTNVTQILVEDFVEVNKTIVTT
ncbi:MAG: hypothetical protein PF508_07030 [Spirochaeta sp.]|jgi:hypothetical protein|nr:hypothetical protein [Spirochaeta sp.]